MQEPWKRGGITWAVELRANPFGYAPATEHDRFANSWDGDTHLSGVEPAQQALKLATQIRERRLTGGLSLAVLEHVIETYLLGPRKVERACGIDGYRTSKVSGADALRILSEIGLRCTGSVGAREQIQTPVPERATDLLQVVRKMRK